MIEAWNKIDLLASEEAGRVAAEAERRENVVRLSATSGEGVDTLIQAAADRLREENKLRRVKLSASDGEAIAWLHANGEVLGQRSDGIETELEVRLSAADWARFQSRQEQQA